MGWRHLLMANLARTLALALTLTLCRGQVHLARGVDSVPGSMLPLRTPGRGVTSSRGVAPGLPPEPLVTEPARCRPLPTALRPEAQHPSSMLLLFPR